MTDSPSAARAGTLTVGDRTVHRLGFGAMRITGDGVWGPPPDRATAVQVLRRAAELGVDFVDTADSYGPDVSEELIAEAYRDLPAADRPLVATKGGFLREGPNRWHPDGRPEHLRAACEGSLRRLGVERIDLYQLHVPDPDVPYAESVGALAELQAEGKVHHLGVSNVGVDHLREAQGVATIVSVQNRYNHVDRSSDDVLAICEQEGLAFIPWAPVGGKAPGEGDALAAVAARHGVSPVQVAVAWLLARSPQMLPIPGTGSVAHLEQNVAAAGLELTDDDLAALAKAPKRRRTPRQVASDLKRRLRR
ncbi:MAG TPA: aldo/keto reductase [Acidimicrobiales bacterium]